MNLNTTRTKIRGVSEAWRHQYGPTYDTARDSASVQRRLDGLNAEAATAADVAAIIGNDTWTEIQCAECGALVEAAVELGSFARDAWDGDAALVCLPCLRRAVMLADNAPAPTPTKSKEDPTP